MFLPGYSPALGLPMLNNRVVELSCMLPVDDDCDVRIRLSALSFPLLHLSPWLSTHNNYFQGVWTRCSKENYTYEL
jgi:hypothetical protein